MRTMNRPGKVVTASAPAALTRAAAKWAAALALGAIAFAAHAQQATERYIPLGQSPGLSGKTAMMGTVVGYADGVLTLASPAYPGPQRVRMLPETWVWLDRSAQRQTNVRGSAADLLPGRRVEVRFVDPASRLSAAWVKVEPAAR